MEIPGHFSVEIYRLAYRGGIGDIFSQNNLCHLGRVAIVTGTVTAGVGGMIFIAGLATPLIPDGEAIGGAIAVVGAITAGTGQVLTFKYCKDFGF
jgi:hypothetical protein